MSETTPLIKAALNLRVGAGFDVYDYPSSSDVFSEISSYELEKYILDFIKMQKNEVQMIIYLDYEKKLSLHEIADVMGETEGAVKMKLYRFRKKLKQYLINEGFV